MEPRRKVLGSQSSESHYKTSEKNDSIVESNGFGGIQEFQKGSGWIPITWNTGVAETWFECTWGKSFLKGIDLLQASHFGRPW